MERRDFLKLSGASASALALGAPLSLPMVHVAGTRRTSGKALVVIYLRGGQDALNTVIPFKDDRYYEIRPTIAIPRPGAEGTKEGDTVIGNRVRAKVVKNKVAAPFREAEFDIMFDSGISAEGDLLDLAIADQIVAKTGAWFSYKNVRLGQGRENAKQFMRDNADLFAELTTAVLAKRRPAESCTDKPSGERRPGPSRTATANTPAAKRKRA